MPQMRLINRNFLREMFSTRVDEMYFHMPSFPLAGWNLHEGIQRIPKYMLFQRQSAKVTTRLYQPFVLDKYYI